MKTKENILRAALKLFNIEGVECITTRHIAAEMGISQGNLHYHYPNKNAVIEALFQEFITQLKNAERYDSKSGLSKEHVWSSMADNYKIMYDYRFFFRSSDVVWRRIPTIKTQIVQLFQRKRSEILSLIEWYQKEAIFRSDISPDQMNYLADQFIFSISSWLTASEYLSQKDNDTDYFVRFTFRQWLPYLTPAEMQKWEALLT